MKKIKETSEDEKNNKFYPSIFRIPIIENINEAPKKEFNTLNSEISLSLKA